MIRAAASVAVLLAALATGAHGQTPTASSDSTYLFIDETHALKKFSNTREKLAEAGEQGYGVQSFARLPGSLAMLLKRDGTGPRTYRVIDTTKYSTFMKELNDAGAEGFKLLFAKVYRNSPTAVLVRQKSDLRFRYSAAEGEEKGVKALVDASTRGSALVAIVGESFLVLEDLEGGSAPVAAGSREYRILSTNRVATLEKELEQAAAEGFRVIGAGLLTLVLEREPGSAAAPLDYHVAAMAGAAAAERELQAAGAEGFRIAAVSESHDEVIFVLHRPRGTSDRFDYRLAGVTKQTANDLLLRAEAEGYRVAVLLGEAIVFERLLPR